MGVLRLLLPLTDCEGYHARPPTDELRDAYGFSSQIEIEVGFELGPSKGS